MVQFRFPDISTENRSFLEANWNTLQEELTLMSQSDDYALRLNGHHIARFYPEGINAVHPYPDLTNLEGASDSPYCQKIGFEFWPYCSQAISDWLIAKIQQEKKSFSVNEKLSILNFLSRSELFETFLHTRYVGQKRFSLQGAETLIPMLGALVESLDVVDELVIGMPHRGRLNVLVNIMNKSPLKILSEFEDISIDSARGGDVKYHKGYFSEAELASGHKVRLWLAANPSHLESVDPVVEGIARARQKKVRVLPLLIHGDASIAGQGVVYETLQLAGLAGYSTGGTIHIVNNNHIGFTTRPVDFCSTRYCTDIAKAFGIPVFHVSAEDPESCVWVMKLAFELRQTFHTDVIIDLNSYRKYGHNESDEPAFTQPLLYETIRKKQSIRTLYHDALVKEGAISKEAMQKVDEEFKTSLHLAQKEVKEKEHAAVFKMYAVEKDCVSAVSKALLESLLQKLLAIPEGFSLHPRIQQQQQGRAKLFHGTDIDWAFAETLAFATLLAQGHSIRLTGQDTRRGTFSQRHGMWVDQKSGQSHYPLQNCAQDPKQFELIDSPLSEFAVLAFEYGYSLGDNQALVLWEAQFGDFVNSAQVIIDQYIASGEEKWGVHSRLVLLLPHGYEGQGPEHSLAHIGRFLSLCAHNNMYVANPTTPSQLFHLLRRQAQSVVAKPLILFTPKALLRHPKCQSRVDELTTGAFAEVLDDSANSKEATHLLFCQGKIYYDLVDHMPKNYALIRIEQLYPFPKQHLERVISQYPLANRFMWVQEESKNLGPWNFVRDDITALLPRNAVLEYRGRPASSSPAVGSHKVHIEEEKQIIESLFTE
jgi:2-oxoglutarate dehydrogenase E1 component